MPESTHTVLARFPMMILESSEEIGVSRAELLGVMGLSEEQLKDPEGRVPMESLWSFWKFGMKRFPGRPLGLEWARHVRVRDWGLVGYTMLYSRTLRDALERLTRYSSILTETMRVLVKPGPANTRIMLGQCARAVALRHPVDLRLANIAHAAREITQSSVTPLEVHFPYVRPADIRAYQTAFGAPVFFGESDAALVYRNEELARTVIQADETLVSYLDRFADDVLKHLTDRGSFTERVRRAIWTELSSGQPSLRRTAENMGVSTRSLQRKLRDEGTTFADLLDEFRKKMALRLLADEGLAIYEIAFLLGYSEPSTFFRAFRRWEGTSPQAYRKKIA
jgi:AraC-like DNA-binding protein